MKLITVDLGNPSANAQAYLKFKNSRYIPEFTLLDAQDQVLKNWVGATTYQDLMTLLKQFK